MNTNDKGVKALGKALRAHLGAASEMPADMQVILLRLAYVEMLGAERGSRNPEDSDCVLGQGNGSQVMKMLPQDQKRGLEKRVSGTQEAPKPDTVPLPVPHRTSA